MAIKNNKNKPLSPVDHIIKTLGGITQMAEDLKVPKDTVTEWKSNKTIPYNYYGPILSLGKNAAQVKKLQTLLNACALAESHAPGPMSLADHNAQFLTDTQTSKWIITGMVTCGMGTIMMVILIVLFFMPEFSPFINNSQTAPAVTVANQSNPQVERKMTQLSNQLDDLSVQINTIQSSQSSSASSTKTNNNPVNEKLDDMESRLNDIAASTGQWESVMNSVQTLRNDYNADNGLDNNIETMTTLIKQLTSRVESLSETVNANQMNNNQIKSMMVDMNRNDLKAAGMIMALTQFRGALDRDVPFDDDLNTMRAFIDDPELLKALDQLEPYAGKGIATNEELKRDLNALTDDIIAASLSGQDLSILERTKNHLGKYVTVYKPGIDIPGTDIKAILNRARNAIERQDVNAAIEELSTIRGPAAAIAEPFINEAKMRVVAEDVVDQVSKQASALIREAEHNSKNPTDMGLF